MHRISKNMPWIEPNSQDIGPCGARAREQKYRERKQDRKAFLSLLFLVEHHRQRLEAQRHRAVMEREQVVPRRPQPPRAGPRLRRVRPIHRPAGRRAHSQVACPVTCSAARLRPITTRRTRTLVALGLRPVKSRRAGPDTDSNWSHTNWSNTGWSDRGSEPPPRRRAVFFFAAGRIAGPPARGDARRGRLRSVRTLLAPYHTPAAAPAAAPGHGAGSRCRVTAPGHGRRLRLRERPWFHRNARMPQAPLSATRCRDRKNNKILFIVICY